MNTLKRYYPLEVDLKIYICNYQPKGWQCPISHITNIPFILPAEARDLIKAYEKNSLDNLFKNLGPDFQHSYVVEAIKDYFNKEKFNELEKKPEEEDD